MFLPPVEGGEPHLGTNLISMASILSDQAPSSLFSVTMLEWFIHVQVGVPPSQRLDRGGPGECSLPTGPTCSLGAEWHLEIHPAGFMPWMFILLASHTF